MRAVWTVIVHLHAGSFRSSKLPFRYPPGTGVPRISSFPEKRRGDKSHRLKRCSKKNCELEEYCFLGWFISFPSGEGASYPRRSPGQAESSCGDSVLPQKVACACSGSGGQTSSSSSTPSEVWWFPPHQGLRGKKSKWKLKTRPGGANDFARRLSFRCRDDPVLLCLGKSANTSRSVTVFVFVQSQVQPIFWESSNVQLCDRNLVFGNIAGQNKSSGRGAGKEVGLLQDRGPW